MIEEKIVKLVDTDNYLKGEKDNEKIRLQRMRLRTRGG